MIGLLILLIIAMKQVSDIPYAEKFGGATRVDMSLKEYIGKINYKNIP